MHTNTYVLYVYLHSMHKLVKYSQNNELTFEFFQRVLFNMYVRK